MSFLHFFQDPVRAGLRAKEDHGASGTADGVECRVGIAIEGIDARFAPPVKIQWRHALGKLPGVALFQKEIHVVKLHGIRAVLHFQVTQN